MVGDAPELDQSSGLMCQMLHVKPSVSLRLPCSGRGRRAAASEQVRGGTSAGAGFHPDGPGGDHAQFAGRVGLGSGRAAAPPVGGCGRTFEEAQKMGPAGERIWPRRGRVGDGAAAVPVWQCRRALVARAGRIWVRWLPPTPALPQGGGGSGRGIIATGRAPARPTTRYSRKSSAVIPSRARAGWRRSRVSCDQSAGVGRVFLDGRCGAAFQASAAGDQRARIRQVELNDQRASTPSTGTSAGSARARMAASP